MSTKKELYLGDLMMLGATVIWGAMTVFSKQILAELAIFNMIALRFLIGFAVCLAVFHRRYRGLSRETVLHSLILGVLLFVSYLFMVWGCKYTTASNAGFMMSLTSVFIPIILRITQHRAPSLRLVVSIAVTLTGVGLMCLSGVIRPNWGDLICVGSAFFYSFQMIYTEKYAHRNDPVVLGTLQLLFVSLLGFVCCFLFEDRLILPQSSAGWVQLLYLAVMCGGAGFILQTGAEKRIPSSHASLIYATQPVFVALSAVLLMGETINLRQIIGILVVFCGVLIVEYRRDAAEEKPAA
ncbi:MAG: DMT family transporter [Firmicutes bacterium]|nr:DMT family transporter [Bacillota bacterium]